MYAKLISVIIKKMAKRTKGKNKKSEPAPQQSASVKKSRKELRKTGFYYSFLTIVLLFCLIQVGFSAILNISKLVAYKAKIITLKKTLTDAEEHNKNLKEEIKMFSTTQNLEGIARNTLKMAGEDEVLIIINNTNQETKTNKKHNKKSEEKNAQ